MKALTFLGKEKIGFENIADPIVEANSDVIVKVEACAICGSDLHPYYEREKGLDHHCAMGHEFTGEVVETGKAVQHLIVGDKVMSPFSTSCGKCFYCKKGLSSRCVQSQLFGWRSKGLGLHGGQAEFVRVPLADQTLLKRPSGMSKTLALLLGDILSTGYFCASQGGIHPDEVQVVFGCGPVGLMCIWSALKLGATKVFAVDNVPARLEMAEAWGAIPIDFSQNSPREVVAAYTNGRGADLAMEAVGSSAATKSAFEILRPGGVLSAVGVNTDAQLAFNPVQAYDKNITYKIGRCPARFYMEQLIEAAMEDSQRLSQVFSHQFPLSEGPEAYALFANKKDNCLKVLLRP